MSYEYTIKGRTQSVTVEGELSDYADITHGEEIVFEFYIKGGTDPEGKYQTLKEYQKYAAYASIEQTLGDVYYHVTTNFDNATVSSPVVQIAPDTAISEARGVWGVVTNIEDNTEIFNAIARVDMTVGVLADADDYDNHTAVRKQFSSDLSTEDTDEVTSLATAFESAFIG